MACLSSLLSVTERERERERERDRKEGEGGYAQMRPLQGPLLNQRAADREVHELLQKNQ